MLFNLVASKTKSPDILEVSNNPLPMLLIMPKMECPLFHHSKFLLSRLSAVCRRTGTEKSRRIDQAL